MQLAKGVKLPPRPDQSVVVEVSWSQDGLMGPLLLEPDPQLQVEQKAEVADALVCSRCAGIAEIVLTGFTQKLEAGMEIGTFRSVEVIDPGGKNECGDGSGGGHSGG